MSAIPTLANTLPRLWALAQEVAAGLQSGNYADWTALFARLEILTDAAWIDELDNRLPGWRKIATIKSGLTAKHTLVVLAISLNLPEYAAAPETTRREIEWAACLHDLDKNYLSSGGKDAAHAFRSAGVAAVAMTNLGFRLQPSATPVEVGEWAEMALAAQQWAGGNLIHDHRQLREIVTVLAQLWGPDSAASRILKAILFHQSLPTLSAWTNPVLLSDAELRAFVTLPDLELLGPLLIADSDAWNLFDEPRLAYLEEIRANLAATRANLRQTGRKNSRR